MNKASFIIPVYPPHYHYLDFLSKIDGKPLYFDIILVLSYISDFYELEKYNYKGYSVIILEDYFDKEYINDIINKKVIITFKKYYALNLLKNKYLYSAVVDSEIEFVNINNVFEKFKNFCDKKQIIGSMIETNDFRHKLIKDINNTSSIFFTNDNMLYERLKIITKDFNIYFWFSDIPIYDMSYIDEFFEFIKFNETNFINNLTWSVFDFIPYVYFVLLFKDYKLINIKDYGLTREWSLESMPIETYNNVIEKINYRPLWLIHNVYNENRNSINNDDIILTYHRNDGRCVIVND
jgi:hypothetical protein